MTREQAVNAYRRTKNWSERASNRLRETILVPYFGDMCRMHNCVVNFEHGYQESPVNGKHHHELVRLAKRYDFEQNRIWRESDRLATHFAKFF